MKKLTVIGGAGYLGIHLIKRLKRYDITSLDRLPFPEVRDCPCTLKVMVGDGLDSETLSAACDGADIVWIRAGVLGGKKSMEIDNAELYLRQNTELVHMTLKVCDAVGCTRVLYDSTEQVFSTPADQEPHFPDNEPRSPNFYGASKAIAEKSLLQWSAKTMDRSVQIFRYSRIRSADTHDVLRAMIKACLEGKPIEIMGDPSHRISFVHLDDVIAANEKALERRPECAIYHISSERPFSLLELAQRVQTLSQRQVPVHVTQDNNRQTFEPFVVGLEAASSYAALGIQPRWTLDQMIQESLHNLQKK